MIFRCNTEMDVLLLNVVTSVNALIIGLCYLFIDYYYETKGQLSIKRIQYPGRNGLSKINWELVTNAIHLSAINSIVALFGLIFIYAPLAKYRGVCDASDNSILWNVLKLPFVYLLTDIIFYITHRMFHNNKWLYQNIHKIHHQFVDCYSLTANACHPIEHIVTNMSCVLLPLIILKLPVFWVLIWSQIAVVNSSFVHSGYVFIKGLSPIPHDFHHHFIDSEFGAGQFLDILFHTTLQSKHPVKYDVIIKPYV